MAGTIKFGEDQKLTRLASKAGIRVVLVGMESINLSSLKAYHKTLNAHYLLNNKYIELINNIRSSGIAFLGAFILGGDEDTWDSFVNTLNFIKKAKIDILQITKPTPLPGTALFEALAQENRIIDNQYPASWENYRFTRLVFEPRQLSRQTVYKGFDFIKKDFYSLPVKIKRYCRTLIDTKKISTAIISYLINRSYEKAYRNSELYQKHPLLDNASLCQSVGRTKADECFRH